jgi:hypothetical protein
MDDYSTVEQIDLAVPRAFLATSFARNRQAPDYCSLVDRRWRDFIHCMMAASVYRMALSLILMNGGPSPRMRALASQDTLILRRLAVSLGVRRTKLGVAGFWGAGTLLDSGFTVIRVTFSC